MCGIAGILALQNGAPVQHDALIRLRDAQTHRGPDDAGHWFDAKARVGLGHRRLSIIDLTASGHQPMHTVDDRLHIGAERGRRGAFELAELARDFRG